MGDIYLPHETWEMIDRLHESMKRHITEPQYNYIKSGAPDRFEMINSHQDVKEYNKSIGYKGVMQEYVTLKTGEVLGCVTNIPKSVVEILVRDKALIDLYNPDRKISEQFTKYSIDKPIERSPVSERAKQLDKVEQEEIRSILRASKNNKNTMDTSSIKINLKIKAKQQWIIFLMRFAEDERFLQLGEQLADTLYLKDDSKENNLIMDEDTNKMKLVKRSDIPRYSKVNLHSTSNVPSAIEYGHVKPVNRNVNSFF